MRRDDRRDRSACATCPADRANDQRAVLTGTPDEQASDIRAYAEAGLDELMLSMPWRSLDDLAIEPPRVHARRRSPACSWIARWRGLSRVRIVMLMRGPTSEAGDTFGTQ